VTGREPVLARWSRLTHSPQSAFQGKDIRFQVGDYQQTEAALLTT
jgi:hypothetical protein